MTNEQDVEVIEEGDVEEVDVDVDTPPAAEPGMTLEKRTAELATRTPQPEFEQLREMAKQIADTELVPRGLRNRPDAILATMLTGRELDIGPMQSLRQVYVTDDGKVGLMAELMLSLVRRAGHTIVSAETSATEATITGRRHDTSEELTVKWTLEDAKKAGLASRTNYQRHPADMLWARCVSRLCRRLFPDVVAGAGYTPEELGEVVAVVDVPAAEAPPAAPEEMIAALRAALEVISAPEGKDGWTEESVVGAAARSFNRPIEKLEDLTVAEVQNIAVSIKRSEDFDVFEAS